jgi:hypothetical protein
MNSGELKTFKKMFKSYYEYLMNKNENSMLARIYGIFTVKLEDIEPIHLILMGNTLNFVNGNDDFLDSKFDLKGSLHGRLTKEDLDKKSTVLKDLNL